MAGVSSKDFFDVGQSGVHPGNNLVKIWLHNSRYETRKEENNTESFCILGYLLKVIIRL